MASLRVAHVIDSLALGGAERVAVDLANGLTGRGVEVVMCATRQGGPLGDDLDDDIELVVLGRRRRWDVDGLRRFAHTMQERGVDLIHSHGRSSMRLASLARALRLLRVTHVFHDHSSAGAESSPHWLTEALPMRWGVDACIGVDERLVARACRVLPASRVVLVRNWVDLRRFDVAAVDVRRAFGVDDHCLVTIVVANLRAPKDHATLLEAVAAVGSARFAVLLVGESSSDLPYVARLRNTVARLGMDDRVRFLGVRSDVPALLRGSDIGLFSSTRESGPVAVAEYLAAGLPVIATDTGQLIDAVRPYDVVSIIPSGDVAGFATALEGLASLGPEERRRLGQAGRAVAEQCFSASTAIDTVLRLYSSLLDRPWPDRDP